MASKLWKLMDYPNFHELMEGPKFPKLWMAPDKLFKIIEQPPNKCLKMKNKILTKFLKNLWIAPFFQNYGWPPYINLN